MSKEKKKTQPVESMDEKHTPDVQETIETGAGEGSGNGEIEALKQQLEAAMSQSAEYKDGWQRSVAEFSNYKRRMDAERVQSYQMAVGDILKDYLPVVDDLERALRDKPSGSSWADGIELIYRKLRNILEAKGLTRMDAEGKMFDPNFHEAISQEPSDDHESGQIIEVIAQGYMLGDRVIRPAMVRVAA